MRRGRLYFVEAEENVAVLKFLVTTVEGNSEWRKRNEFPMDSETTCVMFVDQFLVIAGKVTFHIMPNSCRTEYSNNEFLLSSRGVFFKVYYTNDVILMITKVVLDNENVQESAT